MQATKAARGVSLSRANALGICAAPTGMWGASLKGFTALIAAASVSRAQIPALRSVPDLRERGEGEKREEKKAASAKAGT